MTQVSNHLQAPTHLVPKINELISIRQNPQWRDSFQREDHLHLQEALTKELKDYRNTIKRAIDTYALPQIHPRATVTFSNCTFGYITKEGAEAAPHQSSGPSMSNKSLKTLGDRLSRLEDALTRIGDKLSESAAAFGPVEAEQALKVVKMEQRAAREERNAAIAELKSAKMELKIAKAERRAVKEDRDVLNEE